MSVNRKRVCLVCGRVFPEGQGVVIRFNNEILEFHSNKCFAKFARALLERLPSNEVKGYIKRLKDEFEETINQRSKLKIKKL
ncbi:MAG: hypothetical protein QW721_01340 [Desulfurococcaceae archaeon]